MTTLPQPLQEILEDFDFMTDRKERQDYLIEIADRFQTVRVPEHISQRPHDEAHHVQMCESDAYVWAVDREDGTHTYYFDVLNPQGLSAMAMSVILHETLSGLAPEEVARVPADIVFKIFGREVSMGKGQGLMGIVSMVSAYARQQSG